MPEQVTFKPYKHQRKWVQMDVIQKHTLCLSIYTRLHQHTRVDNPSLQFNTKQNKTKQKYNSMSRKHQDHNTSRYIAVQKQQQHTYAHTHARTHARTHPHAPTRTHTHAPPPLHTHTQISPLTQRVRTTQSRCSVLLKKLLDSHKLCPLEAVT